MILLTWLGSGFAFSIGFAIGIWMCTKHNKKLQERDEWHKAHCERVEDRMKRQADILERIATAQEKRS